MNFNRLISVIAGFSLMSLSASAVALVQQGEQEGSMPPVKYSVPQQKVQLSSIVVRGYHFPFMIALQMYKKGLQRSWSTDPDDLDKLVCYWHEPVGTHFAYLHCATNRQHFNRYQSMQAALNGTTHIAAGNSGGHRGGRQSSHGQVRPTSGINGFMYAFSHGEIPITVGNFATSNKLSRSTLAPLLEKIPPANSSYTLQVTDDEGRPVLRYVISHGRIKHVYHYVYKEPKGTTDD